MWAERANKGSKKGKKWQKGQMAFFCLFCCALKAEESAKRIAVDKGFANAMVARPALLDSLAIRLLICLPIVYL